MTAVESGPAGPVPARRSSPDPKDLAMDPFTRTAVLVVLLPLLAVIGSAGGAPARTRRRARSH